MEIITNNSLLVTTTKSNFSELLSHLFLNGSGIHFNETSYVDAADSKRVYKSLLDILMLLALILIMMSMGCELTLKNLLQNFKKPVGLIIGTFCQFGIMPLSAFCFLLVTSIEGLHATGVLIISCSPGGAISNFFTYFCDGNLALSVAMTTTSTVIAMGMMPFNVWLYGRHFESSDLVIPYLKLVMSLITISSPVLVGILIKWKFPFVARYLAKVGSYVSIFIGLLALGLEIYIFPNMFSDVSLKVYVIILTLPAIGMVLGYILATMLKVNSSTRKTISIECGVQNVTIALTVIALSFPFEMQELLVPLPLLYFFSMSLASSFICIIYNVWKKYFKKTDARKDFNLQQDPLDPLLEQANQVEAETEIKTKHRIVTNEKQIMNSTICV